MLRDHPVERVELAAEAGDLLERLATDRSPQSRGQRAAVARQLRYAAERRRIDPRRLRPRQRRVREQRETGRAIGAPQLVLRARGPRAEEIAAVAAVGVEGRAVDTRGRRRLRQAIECRPVAGEARANHRRDQLRLDLGAAERLQTGDVVIAGRARRIRVQHDVVGRIRAGVERRRRAEEESDDGRPDRDRHVHRPRVAGDEGVETA